MIERTLAPAVLVSLILAAQAGASGSAPPPCSPSGMSRADLLRLKESKFEVPSTAERDRMAVSLLGCLDDPDPSIRDGVVFEALSTWLRGKALSAQTIVALEASLSATLAGPKDPGGFRLPFAALALSEVARADRIEPVLTEEVRAKLVEAAATSLARVDDYRGFDPVDGWRHGVAHGSDLVLQLALNPRIGADGLKRLMAAVATQVAPKGKVFYTFGEPGRLARSVVFAHRRGLLDLSFWESWFTSLANPSPLPDWGSAFLSVEGLARRHNSVAFLHALSFEGRSGGDEAGRAIAALADRAAIRVGGG